MRRCTWMDCDAEATCQQLSQDGKMWADLCEAHDRQLGESLVDAKMSIGSWIKAQGGSKMAARRMVE